MRNNFADLRIPTPIAERCDTGKWYLKYVDLTLVEQENDDIPRVSNMLQTLSSGLVKCGGIGSKCINWCRNVQFGSPRVDYQSEWRIRSRQIQELGALYDTSVSGTNCLNFVLLAQYIQLIPSRHIGIDGRPPESAVDNKQQGKSLLRGGKRVCNILMFSRHP